jgi:hypothetical protein
MIPNETAPKIAAVVIANNMTDSSIIGASAYASPVNCGAAKVWRKYGVFLTEIICRQL